MPPWENARVRVCGLHFALPKRLEHKQKRRVARILFRCLLPVLEKTNHSRDIIRRRISSVEIPLSTRLRAENIIQLKIRHPWQRIPPNIFLLLKDGSQVQETL